MSGSSSSSTEQGLAAAVATFGELTLKDDGWQDRARHWLDMCAGDAHQAAALFMSVTFGDDGDNFPQHQPISSINDPVSSGISSSMSNNNSNNNKYNAEQLDHRTWKIVEDDGFGQYPFFYVIKSADRVVIIDSGCGTGDNLWGFIKQLISSSTSLAPLASAQLTGADGDKNNNNNTNNTTVDDIPLVIICTHVHFDHVGGNAQLLRDRADAVVCMGSRNPTFSKNLDLMSLGHSSGCIVKPFAVNQWLDDGEEIWLRDPAKATDDSNSKNNNNSNTTSATISQTSPLRIIHTPGHTLDSVSIFDADSGRLFVGDLIYPFTYLSLCNVGASPIEFLESMTKLTDLVGAWETANPGRDAVKLCCGHVETDWGPASVHLHAARRLAEQVKSGEKTPSRVLEDGVAEYSDGHFSLIVPLDFNWDGGLSE